MVGDKAIITTGKWVAGKWTRLVETAADTAVKGHWVNGKWVKEVAQIAEESTPKSKALVNFSTRPATTTPLESGRVYTKMKLDHSPATGTGEVTTDTLKMKPALETDVFEGGKLTIPTTRLEGVEAQKFIEALKNSEYAKAPELPNIPYDIKFKFGDPNMKFDPKVCSNQFLDIADKEGKLLRRYFYYGNERGEFPYLVTIEDGALKGTSIQCTNGRPVTMIIGDKVVSLTKNGKVSSIRTQITNREDDLWGHYVTVNFNETGDICKVSNSKCDPYSTIFLLK